MNKSTLKNLVQTGLVAGTLVAALSAGARAADAPQVHVNYADLNISSPAGAAVLYQRIRVAATQVCETADARNLSRAEQIKGCTDKAIADAVATVGNNALTLVYEAKTHNLSVAKFASN